MRVSCALVADFVVNPGDVHQLLGAVEAADRLLHDQMPAFLFQKRPLQRERFGIGRGEGFARVGQVDHQRAARRNPLAQPREQRPLRVLIVEVHQRVVGDDRQLEVPIERDFERVALMKT